jgi:hypothetical protein
LRTGVLAFRFWSFVLCPLSFVLGPLATRTSGVLGLLGLWDPGTLGLWYPGTLGLLDSGPWDPGTRDFWDSETLGLGTLGLWNLGILDLKKLVGKSPRFVYSAFNAGCIKTEHEGPFVSRVYRKETINSRRSPLPNLFKYRVFLTFPDFCS